MVCSVGILKVCGGLYPESTDLNEFRDEVATDMEGNQRFKATDAGAADEGCRSDDVGEGKSDDLVVI